MSVNRFIRHEKLAVFINDNGEPRPTKAAAGLVITASFAVAVVALFREGLGDAITLLAIFSWLASTAFVAVVTQITADRHTVPESQEESPHRGVPPSRGEVGVGASLDNDAWLNVVEDSIGLLDELERHRGSFDASGQTVVDHISERLGEILERSGLEVIDNGATFDRNRHAPLDGDAASGAPIAEVVSPGFAVGPRVLRRAKVRLQP